MKKLFNFKIVIFGLFIILLVITYLIFNHNFGINFINQPSTTTNIVAINKNITFTITNERPDLVVNLTPNNLLENFNFNNSKNKIELIIVREPFEGETMRMTDGTVLANFSHTYSYDQGVGTVITKIYLGEKLTENPRAASRAVTYFTLFGLGRLTDPDQNYGVQELDQTIQTQLQNIEQDENSYPITITTSITETF